MKKILALAVVAITCEFTNAPKEIQLRYVFKKGDSFEWSQTATVTQHIVVAGTEQNVETGIKGTTLMKTIEASNANAKFEIEYLNISMKLKTAGVDQLMDSEGRASNVFNKVMRSMKGKKFQFTLSKYGL